METGCLVGNKFSAKQIKAIELFAAGTHNCTQVAEEVKVTRVTISKWRRNPQFSEAICTRAKELLKGYLPEIYKVTKDHALRGNHNHIKLILDHLGNIEKTSKRQGSSISFTWDTSDEDSDTI